jgi:aspartyl-tRNA(Asn)/glutamyl-tRNA(Gln) amidotransferase subunit B
LEDGGKIAQETRLYDPDKNETRSMRTKEEAHDYRYFPDPDLPPLVISDLRIQEIWASRPKSFEERYAELAAYEIPESQVKQHAASTASSTFALEAFRDLPLPQVPTVSNWILGPLSAKLNEENLDIEKSKVKPDVLRALARRVSDGTVSNSSAIGEILSAMWNGEGSPDEIIEKRGLKQISDAGAIEKIVDQVVAANAKQVEDYRAGKEKAFNSLVGQVMKATQGKANPAQVNEILKRKLAG